MKKLKAMEEILFQIRQVVISFSGLCSESLKFGIYFLQCFTVFFTLVYAVRQLLKEIRSSSSKEK